jgi:ATP-dependent RNA helicase RhlE
MDLFAPLKQALAEQYYEEPTPIQAQTIPPAIAGQDILGCAQTGTGKTAAFALPILDYLGNEQQRAAANRPIALVLAPTRELAIQISDSFRVYGKHMRFRQALVYGGVGQREQVNAVRRGAEVLIATPGRLLDLMEQGHIELRDVEIFVLDEADRMLDMGFLPALNKIIADLPSQRQSLFFSATLPQKIRELAGQLLFNPISVNVTPKSTSVKRIEQKVRIVNRGNKLASLQTVLTSSDVDRSIVFTRTKHGANALAKKLDRAGIRTAIIHGNKSQNARQQALAAFRQKRVKVLIATDVAARGIDIDGVSHVINYDMPVEPESYVHRIGRTGRAGAKGIAISFCTSDERGELQAIERLIGQQLRIENPEARFDSNQPSRPKQGGARKSARSSRTKSNRTKREKSVQSQFRRGKTTRGSRGKSSRQKSTAS